MLLLMPKVKRKKAKISNKKNQEKWRLEPSI